MPSSRESRFLKYHFSFSFTLLKNQVFGLLEVTEQSYDARTRKHRSTGSLSDLPPCGMTDSRSTRTDAYCTSKYDNPS